MTNLVRLITEAFTRVTEITDDDPRVMRAAAHLFHATELMADYARDTERQASRDSDTLPAPSLPPEDDE